MAEEKPKDVKAKVESAPVDHQLRNHFAGIALAAIIKNQMDNNRIGQEDVAASYAYRYADRMLEASKVISRKAVVSRGVATQPEPEPAPGAPAPLDALAQVE